jgi:hypothetical protein
VQASLALRLLFLGRIIFVRQTVHRAERQPGGVVAEVVAVQQRARRGGAVGFLRGEDLLQRRSPCRA